MKHNNLSTFLVLSLLFTLASATQATPANKKQLRGSSSTTHRHLSSSSSSSSSPQQVCDVGDGIGIELFKIRINDPTPSDVDFSYLQGNNNPAYFNPSVTRVANDETGTIHNQKWQLLPIPQRGPNVYHIVIAGGISEQQHPGYIYLSSTTDGNKVDLHREDDHSGNQWWIVEPAVAGEEGAGGSGAMVIRRDTPADGQPYLNARDYVVNQGTNAETTIHDTHLEENNLETTWILEPTGCNPNDITSTITFPTVHPTTQLGNGNNETVTGEGGDNNEDSEDLVLVAPPPSRTSPPTSILDTLPECPCGYTTQEIVDLFRAEGNEALLEDATCSIGPDNASIESMVLLVFNANGAFPFNTNQICQVNRDANDISNFVFRRNISTDQRRACQIHITQACNILGL